MELAIAFVLGVLLASIGVYLVDRKRRQAWVKIASDEADYVADAELVDINHEAALALAHREASETTSRVADALQATVSELRGEIKGLEQLHGAIEGLEQSIDQHHGAIEGLNETKVVADRVLSKHDWHIAGKGDPHGRGVLIRYECECGAVTYAPEGTL